MVGSDLRPAESEGREMGLSLERMEEEKKKIEGKKRRGGTEEEGTFWATGH